MAYVDALNENKNAFNRNTNKHDLRKIHQFCFLYWTASWKHIFLKASLR